jgi:hypothetical protein
MAQQQKTKNISTQGPRFYNSTVGEDSSTMTLGFWKDNVSITINPALKQKKDGKVYDYSVNMSAVLNVASVKKLLTGIELIEKGLQRSIALEASGNSVVRISTGEEYGDVGMHLAIIERDDNKQTTGMIFYIFNNDAESAELMLDYNEEDGSYDTMYINCELEMLKDFLRKGYEALLKADMHVLYSKLYEDLDKAQVERNVIKGICEQIAYGSNRVSSGEGSPVSGGSVSGSRNFSTRRRRTVSPTAGGDSIDTMEESTQELATTRRAGRQRTAAPVQEQEIDMDDLENELLND